MSGPLAPRPVEHFRRGMLGAHLCSFRREKGLPLPWHSTRNAAKGRTIIKRQRNGARRAKQQKPAQAAMEAKGRDGPPASASVETAVAAVAAAPLLTGETLAEAPRRRASGSKRKASASSSSTPVKRQAKERNLLHHLFPVHNGPCTRARQSPHKHAAASHRPVEHAAASAWASEARGTDASASGGPIKAEEDEDVEEPLVDVEFEAVRSRGVDVHAVPTAAGELSDQNWDLGDKETFVVGIRYSVYC
ncbi:hypothetical protein BHE74_00001916 [Ensete ventricosum]|nr:hypothetical protein BHE74_00001916 [Ensete ventricosum]